MKSFTENIRQVSGQGLGGNHILSGITKRTYTFDEKGICCLAPEQLPLIDEPKYYEDQPELLEADIELYPLKLFTDVIVKGSAQLRPSQSFTIASLRIGKYATSILATGNRKAYLGSNRRVNFTESEHVDEVPLRFDFAYGGADMPAFEKNIPPVDDQLKKESAGVIDWSLANPYRYPRNPFGKGYMVEFDPATFTEVELPNLEDPTDRLLAENFFGQNPSWWYRMPLPRATSWVNYEVFPRLNYFGFQHCFYGDPFQAEEIKRGWVDPQVFTERRTNLESKFVFRCTSGASLGLQLPYLRPGTSIVLENIHPRVSTFVLDIPNEMPTIKVDGRNGKMIETIPNMYSIELDLYQNLLSVVWGGYAKAIRPYRDEELGNMPVEVIWKKY